MPVFWYYRWLYFFSASDHNNVNIIILTSNNEYFEAHCDNCVVPPKEIVASFIILQFWNLILLLRLHLSLSKKFSNSWYTECLLLNFLFWKWLIQNSWWMSLPKAAIEQVLMQLIIKPRSFLRRRLLNWGENPLSLQPPPGCPHHQEKMAPVCHKGLCLGATDIVW